MSDSLVGAEPYRLRRARGATRRWARTAPLVLIAEVEDLAPDGLVDELAALGINGVLARSGAEALIEFGRQAPAAVVVGLNLVDVECEDWIRAVRGTSSVPIFISLGRGSVDEARGPISAGATGIIPAACTADTIAQRVEESGAGETVDLQTLTNLQVGPLELNVPAFALRLDGSPVNVPLKEFELLTCLMVHAGRVVIFDEIGDWLWGDLPDRPSRRTINSHVQKLRTHLGDPSLIRTVWGQGYTVSHLGSA
jgi:two-component system OmpR family response regulator